MRFDWGPFATGSTYNLVPCPECGAMVMFKKRFEHEEWHESIEPNTAHPVTSDRFARLLKVLDSD